MTKHRYVIFPAEGADVSEFWDNIDQLETEIRQLLLDDGLDPKTSFLVGDEGHDPLKWQDGEQLTMIECTESFLEKVKALPLFEMVRKLDTAEKTITYEERDERLKKATASFYLPPNFGSKKPPQP